MNFDGERIGLHGETVETPARVSAPLAIIGAGPAGLTRAMSQYASIPQLNHC